MPRDYSKTAKGESVAFWRNQLLRAEKAWDVKEPVRERLRRIVSDYDYGELIPQDEFTEAPMIDQRDYHILPRACDRLKALAGDEQPEVRFPRAMTGMNLQTGEEAALSSVGEIQDRLVMRAMDGAGAPGENEEGVGTVCTDGIVAYWYEWTGLPSREEVAQARLGGDETLDQMASGDYEPSRLQDHEELGGAALDAAFSDPKAIKEQVAQTAPGEAPFERVAEAAAAHLDAAEAEDDDNPFWRGDKFVLKGTRYPYGKWFRMETGVVTRPGDVRWMARRLQWTPDEVRGFEGFRPSVRKKIKARPFEDQAMAPLEGEGTSDEEMERANGMVDLWHILDRKHGREYMLADEGLDEFLFDRPVPLVDREGRATMRPAGTYTGFFPVSVCRVKIPVRDDAQKIFGTPPLLAGLKGALSVIKLISRINHIVKQASAGWNVLDEEVFDDFQNVLAAGQGGWLKRPPGATKDQRPILEQFAFKSPPIEMFSVVDAEIARTLDDLQFPFLDFSARPGAKTASQEEQAHQAGQTGALDILRRLQMSYAEQSWIVLNMILADASDDMLDEWVGPIDRQKIQMAWATIGVPAQLPGVTLAPASRIGDRMGRAKMLMDLHERAKAEADPLTGAPAYRTEYLIQEAAKTLEVGPLEPYRLTEEERVALIKARLQMAAEESAGGSQNGQSKQPGQQAAGGKTRDSQGKPRGRRENAGRRDSARGRARGPASRGDTSGQARDVGPVRV